MTVLDSRIQPAEGTPRPADASGHAAPLSRDPEARLAALFDRGTVALLTPHDDSGARTRRTTCASAPSRSSALIRSPRITPIARTATAATPTTPARCGRPRMRPPMRL